MIFVGGMNPSYSCMHGSKFLGSPVEEFRRTSSTSLCKFVLLFGRLRLRWSHLHNNSSKEQQSFHIDISSPCGSTAQMGIPCEARHRCRGFADRHIDIPDCKYLVRS